MLEINRMDVSFNIESVIDVYRKEYKNFGFIPAPRLRRDYETGKFFYNNDGWILVGSLKSEITPIHAVYIYPNKRDGSPNKAKNLLTLLPKKKYRVRCHFGKGFWIRLGMNEIRVENKNCRKRDIFVLEGEIF